MLESVAEWLFDTSMGVPGSKGNWPLWLAILFHTSNLIIALTYLAVPAMVARGWKYRSDGISTRQYWEVMAFMPIAGLSRGARTLEIFGPPYHLTTILDTLAAAMTVYSMIKMAVLIHYVMCLPSHEKNQEVIRRLEAEAADNEELRLLNEQIRKENDQKYAALKIESDAAREIILTRAVADETRDKIADHIAKIGTLVDMTLGV